MIARTPFSRAAASIVLASALLAGTAGCTFITPQATLIQYNPGNGVAGKVGSVEVRNTVAVTDDGAKTVSLLITLINSGSKTAFVKLQFQSNGSTRTDIKPIEPGAIVSFGNDGENQIVIPDPGAEPGALLPVYVQYGDNEGTQLMVPVLTADGFYEGLAPDSAAG